MRTALASILNSRIVAMLRSRFEGGDGEDYTYLHSLMLLEELP